MARPIIKRITLAEVEYIAFRLARELMEFGEPIPPFYTRYPEKLESCIEVPFQTFNRKSLYQTFESRAAILFYLMIKNHPFQNGNKRVAVVTLYYFLSSNRRRLKIDNIRLYRLAIEVAASEAKDKDKVLIQIRNFLLNSSEKIKE
jgi:death-on-curing family protein